MAKESFIQGLGQALLARHEVWLSVQATPYIAGGRIINFDEPCDYFTVGKTKASTLSLSVLVAIEMFNALNALSEVRTPSISDACLCSRGET